MRLEISAVNRAFRERFGRAPEVVCRAPGRVNLIGEHTDYNDGFVLPVAIDRYAYVALAPRGDRQVEAFSATLGAEGRFSLDDDDEQGTGATWVELLRGVARTLEERERPLGGADLLVASDVPLGSGLASSAALAVAAAQAFLSLANAALDPSEVALACQEAEQRFVGTRCGIMDPFIACFGEAGSALLLDCRSHDYELLSLPEELTLLVCDSGVRHELATSAYNERRAECEEGLRRLQVHKPKLQALRDVTLADLHRYGESWPHELFQRCRHVISENSRVKQAAVALETGELADLGRLLYQSHRSLRDDFQVSCPELDLLVQLASRLPGVFGARLTGAGFGGATLNLVARAAQVAVSEALREDYHVATGRTAEITVCQAAGAVERLV
ncbi:MAG: galactokinase [Deltaproteobacteria bacterium]|nr:galactokinase [Deltaproteobacteria bacterium]